MAIKFGIGQPRILGGSQNGVLDITVQEQQIVLVPGTVTEGLTADDIVYAEYTSSQTVEQFLLSPNYGLDVNVGFKSNAPLVGAVEGNIVDYVADGAVDIVAYSEGYTATKIPLQMSLSPSVTSHNVTAFALGTLQRHVHDFFTAILSGFTFNVAYTQYIISTNSNLAEPAIARNESNIFLSYFDLSGVTVFRGNYLTSPVFPAALVTSRHLLAAKHVAPAIGEQLVFRRANGTYQTATVLNKTHVTKAGYIDPDLSVIYVDTEITGCKQYMTMPAGWVEQYAPSIAKTPMLRGGIPILRVAMHNALGVYGSHLQAAWCHFIDDAAINGLLSNYQYNPTHTINTPFAEWSTSYMIGGDSGSPSLTVVNGEPILLSMQHTTHGGASISAFITEINTIMDTQAGAVSGTYALQHPDLSSFTSYI